MPRIYSRWTSRFLGMRRKTRPFLDAKHKNRVALSSTFQSEKESKEDARKFTIIEIPHKKIIPKIRNYFFKISSLHLRCRLFASIFFSSFRFVLFTLCIIFLSAFSVSFFSVFRRKAALRSDFARAFCFRISSWISRLVFLGSVSEISEKEVIIKQNECIISLPVL